MNAAKIKTPVGVLGLIEVDGAITQLVWDGWNEGARTPVLKEGLAQLEAYFAGELEWFDLPLAPKGTEFQQQVYAAMSAIPRGQTLTYGDIANALGVPAQPVGQACGSNPIPVIIPCHRVVGADGLGGFSGDGGVEMKVKLLQGEGAYSLLL
ncbi:methylated-DNA--[protein]-cysteine S-methyltransferase [Amylibacter sp. IMCC11727]|uniref:methylated-DNA--[protein]-cysteine S-methyltransferase n=1 Tax=Amylibacter sp. IMCC11727 TaxID=3039851 RepID=UPI00244E37A5|nr:methylated-DNA--[protein]-cysteine S-methyltransferase [Amylibacter sp. IMCC11727]WGI22539.1 methylated-DNA--[protein]-cysteine S-methyltransferase [Amylibacter sp. IMCC11727]